MASGLREAGFRTAQPRATFYVWAGVPAGYDSAGAANKLLDEAAIVGVPGRGFGKMGEGYIRFAATVDLTSPDSAPENSLTAQSRQHSTVVGTAHPLPRPAVAAI